jgi:hypothetical protein
MAKRRTRMKEPLRPSVTSRLKQRNAATSQTPAKPQITLEGALEKHVDEMATFLWTHSYTSLKGAELKAYERAAKVIVKRVAGQKIEGEGELERFIRDALEGRIELGGPSQALHAKTRT